MYVCGRKMYVCIHACMHTYIHTRIHICQDLDPAVIQKLRTAACLRGISFMSRGFGIRHSKWDKHGGDMMLHTHTCIHTYKYTHSTGSRSCGHTKPADCSMPAGNQFRVPWFWYLALQMGQAWGGHDVTCVVYCFA